MARFLIEVPHTIEDCAQEIDGVMGHSQELLRRFDWGCKAGEHIGWAVLEAQDVATAKMMLPSFCRGKARVIGVVKFTPEDVKSMHPSDTIVS